MGKLPQTNAPPIALGTASVVLGSIALILFFLPILNITIAICGLLVGTCALLREILGHRQPADTQSVSELRWAVIGCTLCISVIAIGFIIAYAPLGEVPGHAPSSPFWAPPDRPYVPPPARPV